MRTLDRTEELVISIADSGGTARTAPKSTVHVAKTSPHPAFSCCVSNRRGEVLVYSRAATDAPGACSPGPARPIAVRERFRA